MTLADLWSRVLCMVTRGKVTAASAGSLRPALQVHMLSGETQQNIPLLLPFGMTAIPNAGADVLVLRISGIADAKVALGGNDPALVIADCGPGEVGLRAQGQQIVLRSGGIQMLADGETLRRLVTDQFMALFNAHTHAGGAPPDQPMTAAHLTGATQAGGP